MLLQHLWLLLLLLSNHAAVAVVYNQRAISL
jgi:hypothetical protein